jgi:hypothetical protein
MCTLTSLNSPEINNRYESIFCYIKNTTFSVKHVTARVINELCTYIMKVVLKATSKMVFNVWESAYVPLDVF